jgi:hypothetical protein
MAVSRIVQAELCFALRQMFATIPTLDAPAADRSWHELYKADLADFLGSTTPEIAAQMSQLALRARSQARAIISDY